MTDFRHSQDDLPLKPIQAFSNIDTSMKIVRFSEPPGNSQSMVPNIHGPMGTDV